MGPQIYEQNAMQQMPGSGRRQISSQNGQYSTLPPIQLGHSNSQGQLQQQRNIAQMA